MTAFQIGSFALSNNLVLAPMAGISDRPFRELCRQLGAGMAVAEMLTSDTSLWNSRKSSLRLLDESDPEPRSIQIAGTEPEQMAHAAQQCIAMGAQIIDINMGCPAKKVCSKAAGSALLKDELLVAKILHAVVNAVDAPVTLKIRTGWDQHSKNALQIANIAEQEGICALAIHGRTRADRFLGNAEYDSIAEVKQAISIPVLANGDIDSPEKARYVLDYTKADGLLIGRAAQGRPWIFQEISYFLRTGEKLAPRPIREIKEILSAHLVKMHDFYGSTMGVRIARKHIHWYLGRFPDATLLRRDINQVVCPEAQLACIANYLQRLEQLGVEHAA